MDLVRALSKKNLNISSSIYRKKQELQKSPLRNHKTPPKERNFRGNEKEVLLQLFTPSPIKNKENGSFRKKMDIYHNTFVDKVNNNLLANNSYQKTFQEKSNSSKNTLNFVKNRSELTLHTKSQELFKQFSCEDYHSNANLYGFIF